MSDPSFLARRTWDTPNYFLITLGLACALAMVPLAARRALETNSNRAEDWLPATYTESAELKWFRQHFQNESFLLCTWDGCTLGNTAKLERLADKLSAHIGPQQPSGQPIAVHRGVPFDGPWFYRITTGPEMLEELTGPPLQLAYADAIERLEGAVVGPPARDAQGESLGVASRPTCLIAVLSNEAYATNARMRQAIQLIERTAQDECGIPIDEFRLGGPTADNVAIDVAGEQSFARLSNLSGLVGVVLAWICFRSLRFTGLVVAVGVLSAMVSLALVFYFGVGEVVLGGLPKPHYGTLDAVMMSMPAVVYILGISGAVHLVNYYRDARREHGLEGAAEHAVNIAWAPCLLAAVTTAVGLGSLATSDIVPIRKFGGFTALAVLTTVAILFTLVPVFLHRFPPPTLPGSKERDSSNRHMLPRWARAAAQFIVRRHAYVAVAGLLTMCIVGVGLMQISSSVQLLKLLDPENDLIADYRWIEEHIGNIVPMEIALTVPVELCRAGDQHAEADGGRYRMTLFERMEMTRKVLARVEKLEPVSRTLSASTFAPEPSEAASATARRSRDYSINKKLEESRDTFDRYLQIEDLSENGPDDAPGDRELWRISARVSALKDVDYGRFVAELREVVEPVLETYRRRNKLVEHLHAEGDQLEASRLCLLFSGGEEVQQPSPDSPEGLLADLLQESGVRNRKAGRRGSIVFYDIAQLQSADVSPDDRGKILAALGQLDAVLNVSPIDPQLAEQLTAADVNLIDLTDVEVPTVPAMIAVDGQSAPRVVRAVYTGVIPLVFKTQRQLLVSLRESMTWAVLLIAIVMSIVLRSLAAGIMSMIPNVFPIVMVFGALGWLGIEVDIGIMMTASVALGVAVDDTVHYLTWFRRGVNRGLTRAGATILAYERCAAAMTQTTIIAGLGLAVFVTSGFTPTQKFGYLMVTMLATALVGDLVVLPAILAGPLGRFFYKKRPPAQRPEPDGDRETPAKPQSERNERVDSQELAFAKNAELRARLRSLRRESASPND